MYRFTSSALSGTVRAHQLHRTTHCNGVPRVDHPASKMPILHRSATTGNRPWQQVMWNSIGSTALQRLRMQPSRKRGESPLGLQASIADLLSARAPLSQPAPNRSASRQVNRPCRHDQIPTANGIETIPLGQYLKDCPQEPPRAPKSCILKESNTSGNQPMTHNQLDGYAPVVE